MGVAPASAVERTAPRVARRSGQFVLASPREKRKAPGRSAVLLARESIMAVPKASTICAAAAVSVCLACGGNGDGTVTPEDPPPNDSGPSGNVQLATLTVTVQVEPGDADVAAELGWAEGAVERALVTVRREGSAREDTAQSDASGRAVFEDLLEGNYSISAVRLLDESERELLSTDNADVSVLGGGVTTQVTPPTQGRALSLTAGRRGSILISEWSFKGITPVSGDGYVFGGFIELYNNADTAVYLDGLIVGSGWARVVLGGLWPCTDFDFFRLDPEGVWARYLYRVPGTGRTHRLLPGRTAVLATDAIDHSEFVEGGLDLSRADFEFLGTNDVDNPAVPNLISVGPHLDRGSHGLIDQGFVGVPLVAGQIDLDSLPRRTIFEPQELEHVRLPRNSLLDLGHFIWFGGLPVCDRVVDPSLDGAAASINAGDEARSMQRRVLVWNPDGTAILQDTNTSSRDFAEAPISPGVIR